MVDFVLQDWEIILFCRLNLLDLVCFGFDFVDLLLMIRFGKFVFVVLVWYKSQIWCDAGWGGWVTLQ